MDRARIHEGIRRMRFEDLLGRVDRSKLSQRAAAELLGTGKRTFRRWRDRHRALGVEGLDDRRLSPSPRRAPVAEIERMLGLYRGLTMKHCGIEAWPVLLAVHGPRHSLLLHAGRGRPGIAAYSPQARGRSERAFRTLQDRLPKELALAGIETVEAANTWLREVWLAEYNARFAIAAEVEGSASSPIARSLGGRRCAFRRTGRLATTTRSNGPGCVYNCRRADCGRTS